MRGFLRYERSRLICGIAGFSLSPDDRVNAKALARALVLGIESRGQDATGFAFRGKDGELQVHKAALTASDFAFSKRFCVPKRARTVIMHTRFATQGHQSFNGNNHPIVSGSIAGVHNGMVYNDDSIFRWLKSDIGVERQYDVDSEAIFAMMAYKPDFIEALETIRGPAAVAWLNANDEPNVLHLARASSNPVVVGITENNSMLFASEENAVKQGAWQVGLRLRHLGRLNEGQYFCWQDGRDVAGKSFKPNDDYWTTSMGFKGGGYRGRTVSTLPKREPHVTSSGKVLSIEAGAVRLVEPATGEITEVASAAKNRIAAAAGEAEVEWVNDIATVRNAKPVNVVQDNFVKLPRLFEPATDLRITGARYYGLYAEREDSINEYLIHATQDLKDPHTIAEVEHTALWGQHMGMRPGDVVSTMLMGEVVYGEIVDLPRSFPEGLYTVRVAVSIDGLGEPWQDPDTPWEYVVVQREAYELNSCPQAEYPESDCENVTEKGDA